MRPAILLFSTVCAFGLNGCATPGKLGLEPVAKPLESYAVDKSLAGGVADFPDAQWWNAYHDPALSALIEEGLANSPDLQRATARAQAAQALIGQARSLLLPQLSASGSVTEQKMSQNQIIPKPFVSDDLLDEGKVSGSLSFNLDLWGKNRTALAAATSDARAALVDAAQARLILSTAIASSYYELGRLAGQRAMADRSLKIVQRMEQLTSKRVEQGLDNKAALKEAQSQAARAHGELLVVDEAIVLGRHALAALLGAGPDRGLSLEPPNLSVAAKTELPDNLAANLLGRRPDVVAARLRSQAALSREKSARAAFYPNINLMAVGGLQSIGLDKLMQADSAFAQFGPAVQLPLFDGGALRSGLRRARAGRWEAVAHYDATLVAALRETADAISSKAIVKDRLTYARQAWKAQKAAYQLIQKRQQVGLANDLQLLSAENSMIAAQRLLVAIEAQNIFADIALVRALGGGFGAKTVAETESGQ
jgi:NodT family efflux transporter outer membrane factor (OMF) lipoprotein